MPELTIAYIVGNVAIQIFRTLNNGRENSLSQQKREEYERAVREHQTERMWRIMRESQAVTLDIEEKRQKQCLKDMEKEIDQLLRNRIYRESIKNWPMTVLPIVMKNQALGSLLNHQRESMAMHCILTPSNCHLFNRHVFPYVEQGLEYYCNQHWGFNSTHPILFYSGAWKSNKAPTQPQVESMQNVLGNLPTLLVTPFFRPHKGKLTFKVRMWGTGTSDNNDGNQTSWVVEPTRFRHEYNAACDYDKEEHLLEDAINDIVPYLQFLIGCMADTYFWYASGLTPLFPSLLTEGSFHFDAANQHLFSDSISIFHNLLAQSKDSPITSPSFYNIRNLYKGFAKIANSQERKAACQELAELFPFLGSEEEEQFINNVQANTPQIYCRNPECGSERCYWVEELGRFRCIDCGWEGIKVIN